MGLLARVQAVPGWFDTRLAPLRGTLPWRAYARYTEARGNVLAGGVAYFAFFSLFPAMALGFTVFGLLLGGQEDLQVRLVQYVNSNLGSTVITYRAGGGGVVSVEQLTAPGVLTTAGALGFVVLLLSGLGWIAALRDGVQAVFAAREETNFVLLKVVDLLVLLAAGLAVLVSVVLSVVVGIATDQVLDALDVPVGGFSSWTLNITGQLVLLVVDALIFTLLFHRMSGVAVPLGDVVLGGFVASVGFTVLKLSGSLLLQAATRNRFLAAFGVAVGLLIWMNLVARVTLVGAAFAATLAGDRGHLPAPVAVGAPDVTAQEGAGAGAGAEGPARRRGGAADDEARRAVRVLLAAGFVAGAATTGAVRALGRARRRRGGRAHPSDGAR